MNKREVKLKIIANELAKWAVQIQNLNSLNLYDANIFSENSICDILNLVFDYSLSNVNNVIRNNPAIDLIDIENRIAIQVTSTKTKKKVQSTLDKFFEKKMNAEYDQLFIIILGTKQKNYSGLKVSDQFNFDQAQHIIDFKDLLRLINILPTQRIEQIADMLEQEQITKSNNVHEAHAKKIKKILALKKRIQKDLLMKLNEKHFHQVMYEPWLAFKYRHAIIRSIDDKSWPNGDNSPEGKISSWFKGEFWQFYENGIELIALGGKAIFSKDGYWDILDWKGDSRENNEAFSKVNFWQFLRIPYEYIVDYDMQPDSYYGLPTIYVKYAKDGMPYEDILCGVPGNYAKGDFSKAYMCYYFDNNKRKRLV